MAREKTIQAMKKEGTDAFRLFDGEGINELIVDQFGSMVVLQLIEGIGDLTQSEITQIGSWYQTALNIECVYLKRLMPNRWKTSSKNDETTQPLLGTTQEKWITSENGLKYWIRPMGGFSLGLFIDQRNNREFLAARSYGKRVLNCFSYTCAFSVSSSKKGGTVTSVDVSQKFLNWGMENFVLNGLDPVNHSFVRMDVFDYFKRAKKNEERFDQIILDPPSFSRNLKGKAFSIVNDFEKLIIGAISILEPNGSLFFSTNHSKFLPNVIKKKIEKLSLRLNEIKLPPTPFDFRKRPFSQIMFGLRCN